MNQGKGSSFKGEKKPDFSQEKRILKDKKDNINTADFTLENKIKTERLLYYFEVEEVKTGKIYFAKILRRNKEKNQENNYELFENNMNNEVNFLRQIHYPSIIKYIGYSPNGIDQKHQPATVFEYKWGGTLNEVIHKTSKSEETIVWNDTNKFINIYGITSAISYLHSINVVHRNLNPINIYETEKLYPLVGNFENAIHLEDETEIYQDPNKTIGLAMYLAPEIIKEQKYSLASDIYSLGMIIYEILTGLIPFEGLQPTQVNNDILQGKRPKFNSEIPEQMKPLIKSCWSEDPKARPTAEYILTSLKKDKNFGMPTIDIKEYESYIERIDNLIFDSHDEEQNDEKKDDYDDLIKISNKIQRKSIMKTGILKKLSKVKLVSQEFFYDVFEVKNKTNNKYLAKPFFVPLEFYSQEAKSKIMDNIMNILKADHPSILKSIDFSEYGFGRDYRPTLVTEFNENISLRDVITKSELISQFNATKKLINIYGIACGMSYLHSHNILHRELTPTNIIEDSNFYPKIKDFGIRDNFESLKTLAKIIEISPYFPPESYTNNEYTQKSEVYSFAMIIYAIMTNELPFDQITNTEYMNNIEHQIRPSFEKFKEEILPTPYRELISRCWNNDPNSRPTFSEIKNELETDPKYITPEADTNEYENYKKTINESEAKQKSLEEETNNTNDGSSTQGDKKEPRGKNKTERKSQPKFPGHDHGGSSDDDDDDDKKPSHEPGGGGFGGGNGSDDNDDDDKKPSHEPDGGGNNSSDDDDDKKSDHESDGGGNSSDDGDGDDKEEEDGYEEEEEEDYEFGNVNHFGRIPIIVEPSDIPYLTPELVIPMDYYKIGKEIGHGAASVVNVIMPKGRNKEKIKRAAKIYLATVENYNTNEEFTKLVEQLKTNVKNEVSFHLMLSGPKVNKKDLHPSISESFGYGSYEYNNMTRSVFVVELLNGSLEDIITQKEEALNKKWNDTKRLICIYGIASSMAYLHSKNIIHRDLKPDNVLLTEDLYPKLIDFGLSMKIDDNVDKDENPVGTSSYLAPEIWRNTKYSKASDVYAFGILVFELMMGEHAYKNKNDGAIWFIVTQKKERPEFTKPIPKCYQDLIEKCWNEDPNERPSFDEIVNTLKTDDFKNNVDDEYNDFI